MYLPLVREKFKDVFEIREDGKFMIDHEDKATQRLLYMTINDNIYKNMERFSVPLYNDPDESRRLHKDEFTREEKEQMVDQLMQYNDLKKQEAIIFNATDRILQVHRNLKLMLLATSGPFFIIMFLIKYTIKFGVLYFLYKKG